MKQEIIDKLKALNTIDTHIEDKSVTILLKENQILIINFTDDFNMYSFFIDRKLASSGVIANIDLFIEGIGSYISDSK